MPPTQTSTLSFGSIKQRHGDAAKAMNNVRSRGRPKADTHESEDKRLRRERFGAKFKRMREDSNLTLAAAAKQAGINSPRKLSQYETTCYPPGWVVRAIAPVYGVSARKIADLVMQHSDPEMFRALKSDDD